MPYKRKEKTIYKKVDGLKKKQKCKSIAKAKRAMNLLRGVEHGWKPTGKKARTSRRRKRR